MPTTESIDSNQTVRTCQTQCSKYMKSIPYINKTDLLIQLSSYDSNTDLVKKKLMLALKKPVITPEVYLIVYHNIGT